MARRYAKLNLPPPFLKRLTFIEERVKADEFPFTIPAFQRGKLQLDFERPITIIVGENGTGKSTLIEGIAGQCGFNLSGGNRNHVYSADQNASPLSRALRLSWLPKVTRGFFMRAESFYNFGRYLDEMQKEDPVTLQAYGGKSLHEQSHGESFLALFTNKFSGQALYILDEPEAALSMRRQLEFLK
jgi:predicted ATPase